MAVRAAVRFGIAWGLGLAALAGFHLGYVLPRERALAACRDETKTRTVRLEVLMNAKSPRQQEQLRTRQEELEQQYAAFVFRNEELSRLDFAIREIADKNGLADFSGRPLSGPASAGSTKLQRIAQRDLSLSFTGDFPSFLHFVNELERHQPGVFVNQFTLRGGLGKTAGLSYDMDCTVLYPAPGK